MISSGSLKPSSGELGITRPGTELLKGNKLEQIIAALKRRRRKKKKKKTARWLKVPENEKCMGEGRV